MRAEFLRALERAEALEELVADELVALIGADEEESTALFACADKVRSHFMGDEVPLRGIIEFSNICARNCLYCGLRKDNTGLKRYRMSREEILKSAARAADLGCGTVILQSGEDWSYPAETLAEIVSKIKSDSTWR